MYEVIVDGNPVGTTLDRSEAHSIGLQEVVQIQIREGRHVEWEVREVKS